MRLPIQQCCLSPNQSAVSSTTQHYNFIKKYKTAHIKTYFINLIYFVLIYENVININNKSKNSLVIINVQTELLTTQFMLFVFSL